MNHSPEEKKQLLEVLEKEYPDYIVQKFDVLKRVPTEDNRAVFILQNIYLTGKSKPSPDGLMDGQPIPMMIAPSNMPFAGYLIKI